MEVLKILIISYKFGGGNIFKSMQAAIICKPLSIYNIINIYFKKFIENAMIGF